MAIMGNKWVEKEGLKSIKKTTAPSYEANLVADYSVPDLKKKVKRHSHASRATMVRTLRGVRK